MNRFIASLLFSCFVLANLLSICCGQGDAKQEESLDNGRGDVTERRHSVEPANVDILEDVSPEKYQPKDREAAFELKLLFRNKNVQKELQLTREQVDYLRIIQEEMENETASLRQHLRKTSEEAYQDGHNDDQLAKYSGEIDLLRDELAFRQAKFHQKMKEILLPDQMKWLGQAVTQYRVRQTSPQNQSVLLNEYLVGELSINEGQLKEMQEISIKSRKELKELIAKHRKATHNKLLQVLTDEQRAAFENIFGKKIDF